MNPLRRAALGLLPVAVLTLGASAAIGQDAKDTYSFSFSTSKAKAPAGFNAEGEFPTQRIIDQITLTLPAGTKVDTAAVARCTANQEQAEAGDTVAEACPAGSRVGTGKGIAYLGDAPDPIAFDLVLFNTAGGAIVDIQLAGKTAFTAPLAWSGRKGTIDLSATPSLNARITGFEVAYRKAGTARKPLIRTPATCPRSKKLTASVTARESGAGSKTTSDTTACKK